MKKLFSLLLLSVAFTGCHLIPKKVEFGQDKVKAFPTMKASDHETQRQVAQRAAQKSDETLRAAIKTDAAPEVVAPAKEASVLSDSVASSLGPPLSPASKDVPSEKLAAKLDHSVAKLNERVENFKESNNENVGKKIEGTGFLQVPYFVYLGGFLLTLFILFVIFKVAKVALSTYLNAQTGGAYGLAQKSLSQVVAGGNRFKHWLQTEVPELSAEVRAKVETLFHDAHHQEQDADVKALVAKLLSKKE